MKNREIKMYTLEKTVNFADAKIDAEVVETVKTYARPKMVKRENESIFNLRLDIQVTSLLLEALRNEVSGISVEMDSLKTDDALSQDEKTAKTKKLNSDFNEKNMILQAYENDYNELIAGMSKDDLQAVNNDNVVRAYTYTFIRRKSELDCFPSFMDALKAYCDKYTGSEEWTDDRAKDFKALKERMNEILGRRLNTESSDIYTKHSVKVTSAYAEEIIAFYMGKATKRNKYGNAIKSRRNEATLYSEMVTYYFSQFENKNPEKTK